jgi:hypothetical protein
MQNGLDGRYADQPGSSSSRGKTNAMRFARSHWIGPTFLWMKANIMTTPIILEMLDCKT